MDVLFKRGKKDLSVHFMGGTCGNAIMWFHEYSCIYGFTPRGHSVHHGSMLVEGNKVYRILNPEYQNDPHDMFFADVQYIGTLAGSFSTVNEMCAQFSSLNERLLEEYRKKYTNWFSRLFHYPDLVDDVFLDPNNTYTYKGF